MVAPPTHACQCSIANWLVIIVALLSACGAAVADLLHSGATVVLPSHHEGASDDLAGGP